MKIYSVKVLQVIHHLVVVVITKLLYVLTTVFRGRMLIDKYDNSIVLNFYIIRDFVDKIMFTHKNTYHSVGAKLPHYPTDLNSTFRHC